ncbi:hypothetical protein HK102_012457 [Quaeritorhiza haematococci]|nr:hypothetical protein HK102_012457 [Quaeritorhiza haematococci]
MQSLDRSMMPNVPTSLGMLAPGLSGGLSSLPPLNQLHLPSGSTVSSSSSSYADNQPFITNSPVQMPQTLTSMGPAPVTTTATSFLPLPLGSSGNRVSAPPASSTFVFDTRSSSPHPSPANLSPVRYPMISSSTPQIQPNLGSTLPKPLMFNTDVLPSFNPSPTPYSTSMTPLTFLGGASMPFASSAPPSSTAYPGPTTFPSVGARLPTSSLIESPPKPAPAQGLEYLGSLKMAPPTMPVWRNLGVRRYKRGSSPTNTSSGVQQQLAAHRIDNTMVGKRKRKKIMVEEDAHCGACGVSFATFILHGDAESLRNSYTVDALCLQCTLQQSPTKIPESVVHQAAAVDSNKAAAGSEGGTTKTRKRRRPSEATDRNLECDACKRRVGRGGARLTTDTTQWISPSFRIEVVCAGCRDKYGFCTECGGGGKFRTGKWRPLQLFDPGRRTCQLSHSRIGQNPIEFRTFMIPHDVAKNTNIPLTVSQDSDTSTHPPSDPDNYRFDTLLQNLRRICVDSLFTNVAQPKHMEHVEEYSTCQKILNTAETTWREIESLIRGVGSLAPPAHVRRYLSVAFMPMTPAMKKQKRPFSCGTSTSTSTSTSNSGEPFNLKLSVPDFGSDDSSQDSSSIPVSSPESAPLPSPYTESERPLAVAGFQLAEWNLATGTFNFICLPHPMPNMVDPGSFQSELFRQVLKKGREDLRDITLQHTLSGSKEPTTIRLEHLCCFTRKLKELSGTAALSLAAFNTDGAAPDLGVTVFKRIGFVKASEYAGRHGLDLQLFGQEQSASGTSTATSIAFLHQPWQRAHAWGDGDLGSQLDIFATRLDDFKISMWGKGL